MSSRCVAPMQDELKEARIIDETEYKIARQCRLTGGAMALPEQVSPPSQRVIRRTSPKKQQHEWSSETDDEDEHQSPSSGRPSMAEVASTSRKREQLRMMLSAVDITAVERALDEHATHPDGELQELRRQLIQHRDVSAY